MVLMMMMVVEMICLEVEVEKRLAGKLAALDFFGVHHNVIVPLLLLFIVIVPYHYNQNVIIPLS